MLCFLYWLSHWLVVRLIFCCKTTWEMALNSKEVIIQSYHRGAKEILACICISYSSFLALSSSNMNLLLIQQLASVTVAHDVSSLWGWDGGGEGWVWGRAFLVSSGAAPDVTTVSWAGGWEPSVPEVGLQHVFWCMSHYRALGPPTDVTPLSTQP